jgi:hypothetical protein
MGVNVDRWRRWTPGAAVCVMDTSGGEAIAILGVDHVGALLLSGFFWMR